MTNLQNFLMASLLIGGINSIATAQNQPTAVETQPATSPGMPESPKTPPTAPKVDGTDSTSNTTPTPTPPVTPAKPTDPSASSSLFENVMMQAVAYHYLGFQNDVDPSTVAYLFGYYRWNENHTSRISQPMTKYYAVAKGDSEVKLSDTQLRHSWKVSPNIGQGFALLVKPELTLPTSEFSREQSVKTKPALTLELRRSFFDNKVDLIVYGYGRQYINTYFTTRTSTGGGGGKPLRRAQAGAGHIVGYNFSDHFAASYTLEYNEVRYEEVGKKNREVVEGGRNLFGHNYTFDASLTYELMHNFYGYIGYSQGDGVERGGGLEINAYDPLVSQWYVALDYTLDFKKGSKEDKKPNISD